MRFEVAMHRKTTDYRIVVVEADSAEAARRRALSLVRGEQGPREGESDGEWCDESYGRAVVDRVAKL